MGKEADWHFHVLVVIESRHMYCVFGVLITLFQWSLVVVMSVVHVVSLLG
jgi:hypothetical protein